MKITELLSNFASPIFFIVVIFSKKNCNQDMDILW